MGEQQPTEVSHLYAVAMTLHDKDREAIQTISVIVASQKELSRDEAAKAAERTMRGEFVDDELRTGAKWKVAGCAVTPLNDVIEVDGAECDCEECQEVEELDDALYSVARVVRWMMSAAPYAIGAGAALAAWIAWFWFAR